MSILTLPLASARRPSLAFNGAIPMLSCLLDLQYLKSCLVLFCSILSFTVLFTWFHLVFRIFLLTSLAKCLYFLFATCRNCFPVRGHSDIFSIKFCCSFLSCVVLECFKHSFLFFFSLYWHDRMRSLRQGVRIWNFEEEKNKKKHKKNLSAVF